MRKWLREQDDSSKIGRMTIAELRIICDSVGKDKLALLLGWTVRTLDRKLSGKHKITKEDTIAIQHVVYCERRI